MAIQDIYQSVLEFQAKDMAGLVQQELDAGTEITEILNSGLIAALDEVGERFSRGELFIPEMLQAAQIAQTGLDVLKPLLTESDTRSAGTVVIGTVKGDLHDIGKSLVKMMLKGAGFQVVDLGVDVSTEAFVQAVEENQADILALSALLTTTMPAMQETVARFRENGFSVKIMVGGAPITEEYAEKIGADGYAGDASQAVPLARRLLAG
ncbi:MAG: corrinoid protein [Desulfobacteraceae bacterium]|jgi:5-methyltetrahydrofolate--homocysteine methyltransferase